MRVTKLLAWLAMLIPVFGAAQQLTQNQGDIRQAPTPEIDLTALVRLNNEIASAPTGTIYSVELRFDKPAKLGDIRDATNRLQILRAVALVEFGPVYNGYAQGRAYVGVGTLYNESGSWTREICRPMMIAKSIRDTSLLRIPAEEWSVDEIRVLGPAEAIRYLLLGESLPPAIILSGRKQDPRHLDKFAAAIKRQHAEKIQVQDKDEIPAECLEFTNRILAPVLSGSPTIQTAEYSGHHNADFQAIIRELLAQRAPITPVTLQVTLRSHAPVEEFAKLVEKYEIDGLAAQLEPEDRNFRISVGASLSIHGEPLADQLRRIRCFLELGDAANYDGTWLAQYAQVSLPVSKAWDLVSDNNLIDARLLNEYEVGALDKIEAFHRQESAASIELPTSMLIPPGCSNYMHY